MFTMKSLSVQRGRSDACHYLTAELSLTIFNYVTTVVSRGYAGKLSHRVTHYLFAATLLYIENHSHYVTHM